MILSTRLASLVKRFFPGLRPPRYSNRVAAFASSLIRVSSGFAMPPEWPIRSGGGRRVRASAHSGYGPLVHSATQGELCRHRCRVTRPSCSPASAFNRKLSRWNPPPLMIRAFCAPGTDLPGTPKHCSFISFAPPGAMRIGKRQKHHAAVVGGRDLLAANRCPGGVQRMQPNPTPPRRSRPSP